MGIFSEMDILINEAYDRGFKDGWRDAADEAKKIVEDFFTPKAKIKTALEKRGIAVRAASVKILAEEADSAYKNVDEVVEVSDKIGIATKVVRLTPLAVIKG